MRINNNLMAMNTHRQLGIANNAGAKSMEKLSSGFRINRAGDDAAGLAISEKMRGQIRGLNQASRNAQDSISLIQTAEGALTETHAILQRMRELAVQASNDTNTDADRNELQNEVKQLIDEIDRIGNTTQFNTKNLLNGDLKNGAAKIEGSVRLSNNSTVALSGMDAFLSGVKADGKAVGSYTITRVKATSGGGNSDDFVITGPDGKTITTGITISSGSITFDSGTFGVSQTLTLKDSQSMFAVDSGTGDGKNFKVGQSMTFVFNEALKAEDIDLDKSFSTQLGANTGQSSFMAIRDMRAEALNVDDIDISEKRSAEAAIEKINGAIERVSAQRSYLGAAQNRLEHSIKNLDTASENLQASESRIRDVDMAREMMEQSKQNILQQASTAMLAQANMKPQSVLQLLG
ncbi:flagellin [Clostridium formicaceticum]|uniref:Flagellin n=1 Tax=Clostridium formicaceticum TaxID=1497 RepID=A0AAC9RI41_9CLOT|nr:flagellin [Clostridium formicaceticum]AOY75645.1 flagellin [Clostridium formicaceticum]ARE85959.1 Flagellin B [Clostridium formicaceticum]